MKKLIASALVLNLVMFAAIVTAQSSTSFTGTWEGSIKIERAGPLYKFTLAIVDGRLQGEMTGERDGVVRGRATVDAAKTN
jgi:hypothetical protein